MHKPLVIAHRGLLNGPNKKLENNPIQIEKCIEKYNLDVEIDLRVKNEELYLGHDICDYGIDYYGWLLKYQKKLWVHCKTLEAFEYLRDKQGTDCDVAINYFMHDHDDFVLTSKGYAFTYPNKPTGKYSVVVLMNKKDKIPENCYGAVTDFPLNYL